MTPGRGGRPGGQLLLTNINCRLTFSYELGWCESVFQGPVSTGHTDRGFSQATQLRRRSGSTMDPQASVANLCDQIELSRNTRCLFFIVITTAAVVLKRCGWATYYGVPEARLSAILRWDFLQMLNINFSMPSEVAWGSTRGGSHVAHTTVPGFAGPCCFFSLGHFRTACPFPSRMSTAVHPGLQPCPLGEASTAPVEGNFGDT